ncbi:MAG TPA: sulfatase [Niabella sp.]|nr:sulfatase [Niabella sp.]
MRKCLVIPQLFLTALLPFVCNAKETDPWLKPNIIFILADDLGWADLPAYGNRFNEAPNIDRLVKQGALFTNAYAAAPVCTPTRVSIMSGAYPVRLGFMDFIPGRQFPYESVIVPQNRTQYLPTEVITIGEVMKELGYRTGYFGRWNLGDSAAYQPSNQGFEETNAGRSSNSRSPGEKRLRSSDIIGNLSESFIEKNKDQPFFLFVGSYDVHTPINADSSLIAKYLAKPKAPNYISNAVYAAMIEHIDQIVGRILNKVYEEGLDNNTLIVFFSDNGGLRKGYQIPPMLMPKNRALSPEDTLQLMQITANDPLRGEKGNLYEGGIRVPLIVKYPGKWKGETIIDDVVTSVDFFPSFVGVAGEKLPVGPDFDGVDILTKPIPAERPIFWHYPVFHHGVPCSAVRSGKWKLMKNLVDGSYELYNLEKDLRETSNLVSRYPVELAKLSALLDNWLKSVKAPMPVPNPDFDKSKRRKMEPVKKG